MYVSILASISFFLSLMGYAFFLKEEYDVPYGFGICISASFIISGLWIIGLLLPITSAIYTFWGMGLVLLLWTLFKKKFHLSLFVNWTNLFLILSVSIVFCFLLGRRFYFIDDFNHWATIARSILENQALPDATDEAIRFVSYPPGAALWICYFLTIIRSTSEDMYLFAQAMLVLIYLCPITVSVCDCRNIGKYTTILKMLMMAIIFFFGSICLLFGEQLISLCVDGLLTASSIGLLCFIINYKGTIQKKVLLSLPLLISVISIKDYGLLFSVSAACLLMCCERKNSRTVKDRVVLSVVPLATVGMTEIFWQTYVSKTYMQVSSAPHSLSIDRWVAVFSSRSREDIVKILNMFVQSIFGIKTVCLFLGLVALLLIVYYFQHQREDPRKKKTIAVGIFVLINYIVYLFGLLFVYLFSMEIEGAVRLESYYRYSGVEFCALYGICISYVFDVVFTNNILPESKVKQSIASTKGIYERFKRSEIPVTVFACILLVWVLSFGYSHPADGTYSGTFREGVNALTNEAYQGEALIYAPSQMDGYYKEYYTVAATAYDFRSTKIENTTLDDVTEFEKLLANYSHILIYDVDEKITDYLYANGWQGECHPGLYPIQDGKIMPN